MTVTKVCIENCTPKNEGICAEVSIVLDGVLVIHKVFVINGEKGYFVAMPNTGQTKLYDNQKRYQDLVHPIVKSLSVDINTAVLDAYHDYVKRMTVDAEAK